MGNIYKHEIVNCSNNYWIFWKNTWNLLLKKNRASSKLNELIINLPFEF